MSQRQPPANILFGERVSVLLQRQHQLTLLACASAHHMQIICMDSTSQHSLHAHVPILWQRHHQLTFAAYASAQLV